MIRSLLPVSEQTPPRPQAAAAEPLQSRSRRCTCRRLCVQSSVVPVSRSPFSFSSSSCFKHLLLTTILICSASRRVGRIAPATNDVSSATCNAVNAVSVVRAPIESRAHCSWSEGRPPTHHCLDHSYSLRSRSHRTCQQVLQRTCAQTAELALALPTRSVTFAWQSTTP